MLAPVAIVGVMTPERAVEAYVRELPADVQLALLEVAMDVIALDAYIESDPLVEEP